MKIAIIDDEPLSIDVLASLITSHFPHIEILGTATSLPSAIDLLASIAPDVLFLDVNMPPHTSFDLLNEIDCSDMHIVFCTAHEHYAMKAIRFSAFDYILKPVQLSQLEEVFLRLADIDTKKKQTHIQTEYLKEQLKDSDKISDKILISSQSEVAVVKIDDICFIEAEGSYSCFYLNNGDQLVSSKPLSGYESLLIKHTFVKTHRSYFINIKNMVLQGF